MKIVRFQRIPEWFEELEKEFDETLLDFWFWILTFKERKKVVELCSKKYVKEIKEEVVARAESIKRESVVLKSKITRERLFEKIKNELDDIQFIMNRFAKT